jgi:poly(3-hydroxybutyrate) depolymerase/prenyltransferase beta subunit
MKRRMLGVIVGVVWFSLGTARAESPDDLRQTASLVASLQGPDGGFRPAMNQPTSLGATSSAIRILKHVGGSIPDVLGCIRYVKSCADSTSGGFAQTPGGTPDVATTASGLMAIAELQIPSDDYAPKAIEFFSKNAKDFEQIRIAAAGMEAIEKTSPDFPRWIALVEGMANPDGTFGKGFEQPRDTGGATAALLRMGVKLTGNQREAVIATLRAGQRPDGAWGRTEGESDLEPTYRIMRCLFMLKVKPDLDKLTAFITRCRHADGSYSTRPGAPSSLGGTYFATIILRWARLLNGESPVVETAGFAPMMNGKDLTGWEGDTSLWSARDGMIVGTSRGLNHNDFLATRKSYSDFILKLSFRLIGTEQSNSGVQFRSVRIPGHEMSGYQADIGQNYWGCLYDESRRNKVLVQPKPETLASLRKSDWNQYEIWAMGGRIVLKLNGKTTVDYQEPDPDIARSGKIALQIHAGGPMEIQFKDIAIQELPVPTAGSDEKPGFHLRTVKGVSRERKYAVYVPTSYDGTKTFPVVLFLHGSGEKGDDGVKSAQIGLGAAIAGHPAHYQFLAVFPQAKLNWNADSEDLKDAMAALDDVLDNFKADRNRVILTGLSMGGAGSWSLAAAHPERFAAVAPVCGRGKPEGAGAYKRMPIWAFTGDADRFETVANTRAMIDAINSLGGDAKETEYRGVGHNSWDRVYNDPAVIGWMISKYRQGTAQ